MYPIAFTGIVQASSLELLSELSRRFLPYAWIVLILLACLVLAAFAVGLGLGFYTGLRCRRAALLSRSREERLSAYLDK